MEQLKSKSNQPRSKTCLDTLYQWPLRSVCDNYNSLEVNFDIRNVLGDLDYPHKYVHIAFNSHLVASQAIAAPKKPWRSLLTSEFN